MGVRLLQPAGVPGPVAATPSVRPPRVVVAALAAFALLAAGLQIHVDAGHRHRLSADERAYLRLATDLRTYRNWGDGQMRQPFRWAPGVPVAWAAVSMISRQPVDRSTIVGAEVVATALIVGASGLLAFLLAGSAAAVVAAAAVAIYVPLARAGATLGTETLGALMIVLAGLAVVWALRGTGRPPPLRLAVVGAVLGLAALVRGDLVAVAIAVPAGIALTAGRRETPRRARALGALAGVAGALLVMAPWSVFASLHVHRFVPVTDGGAANLFIGTDLPADGALFGVKNQYAAATRKVHPRLRHTKTFKLPEQDVLDAVAARYPGRSRNAALSAAAKDNLRRYALGRPVAFAGMEMRKLWRMWGAAYGGTGRPAGLALTWEHRILALLALLGLAAGIARRRDRRLVALAAILVLTTLIDVAFVSESRHNVRLMPLLLAAGAAGWLLAFPYGVPWGATRGQPSAPQRTRPSMPSRAPGPATG